MKTYEVTYEKITKEKKYTAVNNAKEAISEIKEDAKRWGYKVRNIKAKIYSYMTYEDRLFSKP